MNYWLLKSEPSAFSLQDLAKAPHQRTVWDGVRNYQARNMLRDEIKVHDLAFFYHSNCPTPGIVGIVRVVTAGYPDPSQCNPHSRYYDAKSSLKHPRWYSIDVVLTEQWAVPISLAILRLEPLLTDMVILRRGNRLSVTPVTPQQWNQIMNL